MDRQNLKKKLNTAVLEGIQIMCRIFWGPDPDSCRYMMENNFFGAFETIFQHSETKSSVILNTINSTIHRFDTHQSFFDHLNECYVRLFVNSKEGICAPLYESCYEFENAPMMGASAAKMKQRFKLRGLSMENLVHEPPDHLSIELEYLYFILQEKEGIVSRQAISFITETMLPWVLLLKQRLKSAADECKFYLSTASLLVVFLEFIASKHNSFGQS